jgi:hypothetical protein
MSKDKEKANTLDQELAIYVAAAANHGRATESGDHKRANSSARKIAAAYDQIQKYGSEGRTAVSGLLHHSERGVRLWAASHALAFAPEDAEGVLIELASLKGSLIGFSAETTLRQWHAGRLRLS